MSVKMTIVAIAARVPKQLFVSSLITKIAQVISTCCSNAVPNSAAPRFPMI